MQESTIQKAADRIWNSIQSGQTCEPVRDIIGETDLDGAYNVQQINTARKVNEGQRIVGCKIGLTSEAVQRQLGVDQPDFGVLTDSMHVKNGNSISWPELMQPKAEAEIAFVMGKDITTQNIDLPTLIDSIECAAASIEIVGSRVEGWNIRITDTIADNASASHFVLGDNRVPLNELDLENCKMSLSRNGEIVSTGEGRACLGNPLYAALWLANKMSELGTPLKAGDIVLAGALGPMVAVQPNDEFTAAIEGLGDVSVSFGQ